MRQEAFEDMRRKWQADLPAILDGVDNRPLPQGWALGDTLEPEWDVWREPIHKTMREVMRVVCVITGRTPDEMRSGKRSRDIARRRHMVITLIDRLVPQRTLSEIAAFMHRDHTTIIHALRNFRNVLPYDADLAFEYDQCCRHFGIKP